MYSIDGAGQLKERRKPGDGRSQDPVQRPDLYGNLGTHPSILDPKTVTSDALNCEVVAADSAYLM
jgi:hypothetical protein